MVRVLHAGRPCTPPITNGFEFFPLDPDEKMWVADVPEDKLGLFLGEGSMFFLDETPAPIVCPVLQIPLTVKPEPIEPPPPPVEPPVLDSKKQKVKKQR